MKNITWLSKALIFNIIKSLTYSYLFIKCLNKMRYKREAQINSNTKVATSGSCSRAS